MAVVVGTYYRYGVIKKKPFDNIEVCYWNEIIQHPSLILTIVFFNSTSIRIKYYNIINAKFWRDIP